MLEDCKCPNCGATLLMYPSLNRATCNYCNSNYRYHSQNSSEGIHNISADNPISFSYEREETGKFDINNADLLTLSNGGLDREYQFGVKTYTGKRAFGENELEARLICFLSTISGMAFLLKKNYFVRLNGDSFEKYDDKDIRKKRKEIRRSGVLTRNRDIDRMLNTAAEGKTRYFSKMTIALNYGFSKQEKTEAVEWGVPATLTTAFYTLNVTPQYFEQYFPTISSAHARIQSRDEIKMIAEKMLARAQGLEDGIPAFWNILDSNIENTISVGPVRVRYHELGMNDAPNLETALAIRLATLGSFIKETSGGTGEYNWDLAYQSSLGIQTTVKRIAHYNDW